MKSPFPLLAAIALLATSCSDDPPTLEEIVEDATPDIREGDTLAFIRLSNDGLINNARVHKVEDDRILITHSEVTNPYWVQLAQTVAYQQASLTRSGEAKPANNENPSSPATVSVVNVSSIEEIGRHLSKIDVNPPRGKKWHEIGILERKDWAGSLTNSAPDFALPVSIEVNNVFHFWHNHGISLHGTDHLPPDSRREIRIPHCPKPAFVEFKLEDYERKGGITLPGHLRPELARLKHGETHTYQLILRPEFSYDVEQDHISVYLRIHTRR